MTVGGEFGHETISRVVKVGKNVKDFQVGERVYPYPRYAKDDTKRAGTIGGFSEYILIPNAKRNHSLYAVDARISDKLASLIEPFTVGCRAARRGMIPDANGSKRYIAEQNVVVFGCGTIDRLAAHDICAAEYYRIRRLYAGRCIRCAGDDGIRKMEFRKHHHARIFAGSVGDGNPHRK